MNYKKECNAKGNRNRNYFTLKHTNMQVYVYMNINPCVCICFFNQIDYVYFIISINLYAYRLLRLCFNVRPK